MIGAEFMFGVVAALGLLAANPPEVFARHFLARWQRERLRDRMSALSWTGWVVFGAATFTLVAVVIADVLQR